MARQHFSRRDPRGRKDHKPILCQQQHTAGGGKIRINPAGRCSAEEEAVHGMKASQQGEAGRPRLA